MCSRPIHIVQLVRKWHITLSSHTEIATDKARYIPLLHVQTSGTRSTTVGNVNIYTNNRHTYVHTHTYVGGCVGRYVLRPLKMWHRCISVKMKQKCSLKRVWFVTLNLSNSETGPSPRENWISSFDIRSSKSVLITPACKSVLYLPTSFWIQLKKTACCSLKAPNRGILFTNC
jgi:hypothetical protein